MNSGANDHLDRAGAKPRLPIAPPRRTHILNLIPMALSLLTFFTPFGLHLAYVIVHECCHGSFFASRRLNEIIGTLFGALSLTPFKSRQFEHAQHHAFSGSYSEPTVRRGIERFAAPLDGSP